MDQTQRENQGIRLTLLRDKIGLNQKDFAREIHVKQPHLSEMERGIKSVSQKTLQNIGERYSTVNISWLLTGEGEMFLQKSEQPVLRVVGEEQEEYAKQDKRVQAVLEVIAMVEQVSAHYDAMAEENRQMREEIAALQERVSELENRLRMDG